MPSSCSQQRVTYVLGGQLNNHDEAGGHTSSVLFMSTAGCESRRLTTDTWPSWAAIYRAVAPPCSGKTDLLSITDSSSWASRLRTLLTPSASAPAASMAFAASTCPRRLAIMRHVSPLCRRSNAQYVSRILPRSSTLNALLRLFPQSSHHLTERLAMPGHPPTQRHPRQDGVMARLGVSGSLEIMRRPRHAPRKRYQTRRNPFLSSMLAKRCGIRNARLRAGLQLSYFSMHRQKKQ